MFGVLLGSGLSFRQTMRACLMSFALFALIVGSLAPVMACMALDRPVAFLRPDPFDATFYEIVWQMVAVKLPDAPVPADVRFIGTAETLLRDKKKFFLEHWFDEMGGQPGKR